MTASRRPMQIGLRQSIDEIAAADWNAMSAHGGYPFLRHEFLAALEHSGAVGGDSGWHPCYLTVEDETRLLGAVPMYLKDHSFGEFVFDWSWAGAFERGGHAYYPKLVVAVPYTPATGTRLLVAEGGLRGQAVADVLVDATLAYAHELQVSSLHWLFTTPADTERLQARGLMLRTGCQFHWRNRGYRDFDDFLDSFSSRNRKKVRQERRAVAEQGISVAVLHGAEIDSATWETFHRFYRTTFLKKGNWAPLSREFFVELGARMPEQVLLILARQNDHHDDRWVAGAIFFRGNDVLYGRHWGSLRDFDHLHFELCYYRAIEYCIEHGIGTLEAGAQGEYKVRRGFAPTVTRSVHWIAEPGFRTAIGDFLRQERRSIDGYVDEMSRRLPYKAMA